MYLQGQGRTRAEQPVTSALWSLRRRLRASNEGYAMAGLLVSIAVMTVLMTVAMPVWKHDAQRQKEEELIFRAGQVVHAIAMYQKRFANQFPPSLDVLVQQKYLRRKYKDPMTKDGEWRILSPQELRGTPLAPGGLPLQGQPGIGLGARPGAPQAGSSLSTPPTGPGSSSSSPLSPGDPSSPSGQGLGAPGGTQYLGPVAGVASRSKEHSIRIFKGRDRYDQWIVTVDDIRPKGLLAPQPGQQQQQGQPGGSGLSSSPGLGTGTSGTGTTRPPL
jgi:type II secretory pathway pseudopilin PulG